MLKYLVESILTTKKYFFRSFFQKQPGFPLKASQNNQLPLFALNAGYRTIPLTAERPKLFLHTALQGHFFAIEGHFLRFLSKFENKRK